MASDLARRWLPRGLYGRAALILMLPVVAIQLVVTVVFVQRHFEDVAAQMTRSLVPTLLLLRDEVEASPTPGDARERLAALGPALSVEATLGPEEPVEASRAYYDLSALVVARVLREEAGAAGPMDFGPPQRRVRLDLPTRHGDLRLDFSRRRVSASNPHQLLVLMAAAGLVLTLVASWFLRAQLRPVRRLARAAEAFGKGQVLHFRPAGAVEVRQAGRAFLDMRRRIERASTQRTLMLSGVSHDLRTPLTRLRLGLELIDDPAARDMVADVEEMERMIAAFLDFARDAATEAPAPVDAAALLGEAIERAGRAGLAVEAGEVAASEPVAMRPEAVSRALDNLIANAARHGSRARASVVASDAACRFTVEDDGPGIPEELREEALKPFARLEEARRRDGGAGVGLGLSIASDVARRHGGALRLGESEALGGLRVDLVLAR
jgi:two-component system osmolarity sensor histidine kinase EnvZ